MNYILLKRFDRKMTQQLRKSEARRKWPLWTIKVKYAEGGWKFVNIIRPTLPDFWAEFDYKRLPFSSRPVLPESPTATAVYFRRTSQREDGCPVYEEER